MLLRDGGDDEDDVSENGDEEGYLDGLETHLAITEDASDDPASLDTDNISHIANMAISPQEQKEQHVQAELNQQILSLICHVMSL